MGDFCNVLLKKVQFIWYPAEDDEQMVFERLNAGKIPLSSSELVKALFLNRTNFGDCNQNELDLEQRRMATEWDTIENALQKDEFWMFVYGGEKYSNTRIDFILDIICDTDGLKLKSDEKGDVDDPYRSFKCFNKYFSNNKDHIDFK